jgi:hypothetical protein
MDRAELTRLLAAGASLEALARASGVHRDTLRRRLRAEGLETARMRTARINREARALQSRKLRRTCRVHGDAVFRVDARGTFRCVRCSSAQVAARRRRVKELLVHEAGGACCLCGYDRCLRALEFHHVDPATKRFGVAFRGVTRSLDAARAEARKCVLLCANCHAEVEAGVRVLAVQ